MNNKLLGSLAEEIAAEFLIKNGYIVLERNYKNQVGEIDIIALKPFSFFQRLNPKKILKNSQIIFVEVKAQSLNHFGQAEERINFFKQEKLKKLALAFLKERKLLNNSFRIDAIRVDFSKDSPRVKHIISAVED